MVSDGRVLSMDKTMLIWRWCDHCEVMTTECPECGMNGCSCMWGTVDGKPCAVCPQVHEVFKKLPLWERPQHEEIHHIFFGPITNMWDEQVKAVQLKLECRAYKNGTIDAHQRKIRRWIKTGSTE